MVAIDGTTAVCQQAVDIVQEAPNTNKTNLQANTQAHGTYNTYETYDTSETSDTYVDVLVAAS